jgi:hypothetical protein
MTTSAAAVFGAVSGAKVPVTGSSTANPSRASPGDLDGCENIDAGYVSSCVWSITIIGDPCGTTNGFTSKDIGDVDQEGTSPPAVTLSFNTALRDASYASLNAASSSHALLSFWTASIVLLLMAVSRVSPVVPSLR